MKINFMGDVMFGELLENFRTGLKSTLEPGRIDPFEHVRPILAAGDFNVINLECVLSDFSDHGRPFSEILISPEKHLRVLVDSKVNIVNTANNHALDHGTAAFARSSGLLRSHGIRVIGYEDGRYFQEEPVVVEAGGRTAGFLGYNISNFPPPDRERVLERILTAVRNARNSVDVLIVSIHWGEEYTNIPPPYVVRGGRQLLDAGCDIVHGHHSHQIQGVFNDGKRIFAPSLGNFIFDQKISRNRITAVLQVDVTAEGISHAYLPFYMNDDYQPVSAPRFAGYLKELDSYLMNSLDPGQTDRYEKRIRDMVRQGHRKNRLLMRAKMLGHFWDYLPHARAILSSRKNPAKPFSVIHGENNLPGKGQES